MFSMFSMFSSISFPANSWLLKINANYLDPNIYPVKFSVQINLFRSKLGLLELKIILLLLNGFPKKVFFMEFS